ncbi:MAG TPA: geranylgeranylglycerol-phosphate geranylgeranyltransferase [Candidatus Krumholzibacteriaceae bacterium]|nr:geranylgeranylglycerol-phosphate geranylgeranyltransferase [Candidatus Krumholzibacteriaceae bacterium]
MAKIGALLRMMRPVNCLMIGFAVIVGAALVGVDFSADTWLLLLYSFLTGFFLTAGSMVANDIIDREIDAVNEPARPIPSGAVSFGQAQVFAVVLAVIGFVFALVVSWQCFVIAVFSWLVFAAYSFWGKRSGFFGNLLVSVCVVLPFVYGGFAVGKGFADSSAIFVALAFLANTGREITKGVVDVEGDKRKGVRTLAVRFGARVAVVVAVVFYVSAVVLSVLPLKFGLVSLWFVPFVLVTDAGLITSSVWLLRDFSRENARRVKNLVLVWFVFGLVAFLAGTIG